jgi:hypothetical protein
VRNGSPAVVTSDELYIEQRSQHLLQSSVAAHCHGTEPHTFVWRPPLPRCARPATSRPASTSTPQLPYERLEARSRYCCSSTRSSADASHTASSSPPNIRRSCSGESASTRPDAERHCPSRERCECAQLHSCTSRRRAGRGRIRTCDPWIRSPYKYVAPPLLLVHPRGGLLRAKNRQTADVRKRNCPEFAHTADRSQRSPRGSPSASSVAVGSGTAISASGCTYYGRR